MSDSQTIPASPERKLATIVAADVAGYSRIMGENEEAAIAVLRGHREIYESLLGSYRGRLFNTAGDAFLSEFASAVDAVRFATELQSAIRTRNDQLPEDQRMQFRIGINIGDVVVQGGDLLGDGVNVAARVQTSAEPGGICISGAVFDQIQNKLMLSIQPMGERAYKNLSQPVRTYSIAQADAGHFPTPPRRKAAAGGSRLGLWLTAAAVTVLLVGGGAWWVYDSGETRRQEQVRLEQKLQAERAAAEDARRKAEAERMAAERQAAEDARRRAEEDRLRVEAERRRIEEDRRRADEERQRADADRDRFERERRAAEEARARAEAERRRAEAERFEAERRAAEEARQRAEEEARRAEAQRQEAERRAAEARKAADEQARRAAASVPPVAAPAPAPAATPQVAAAAAPATTASSAARYNGRYLGQFCSAAFGPHAENCWPAAVVVANGTLSGTFTMRSGAVHSWTGTVSGTGAVELTYDGISTQVSPGAPARAKMRGAINNVVMEMSGAWYGSNRPVNGRFVRQN